MRKPVRSRAVPMDQSEFKTPVVRQAYEYWAGKRVDGRLPRRSDIRPEEVPLLLPYLFLVDVTREPLGFRYRLVGTQIGVWAGREYTGVAINEPEYGPQWRRVFDHYRSVVESREPRRDDYPAPWVSRDFLYYERLIAPLSSDGSTVDMLFGALHVLASR